MITMYLRLRSSHLPGSPMRTRIVRIGNSQGVRIPKVLLEESGIEGEVELRIEEGRLVIENAQGAREGWEAAARALADTAPSDTGAWPTTDFDDDEWAWEEE